MQFISKHVVALLGIALMTGLLLLVIALSLMLINTSAALARSEASLTEVSGERDEARLTIMWIAMGDEDHVLPTARGDIVVTKQQEENTITANFFSPFGGAAHSALILDLVSGNTHMVYPK